MLGPITNCHPLLQLHTHVSDRLEALPAVHGLQVEMPPCAPPCLVVEDQRGTHRVAAIKAAANHVGRVLVRVLPEKPAQRSPDDLASAAPG